jgi:hypothetical protein
VATDIDAPDQQATAHAGLARALHASGDHPGARRHYRAALAQYTELGSPEAELIQADLAALDQPQSTVH